MAVMKVASHLSRPSHLSDLWSKSNPIMKRGHMPLPRPVSFSFGQLSIDFDIDIPRNVNSTDSHPENVDVEVAEL